MKSIFKNLILPLNITLILAVILGDICYISLGGLAIKATTSIFFVLLGMINLAYVIITKHQSLRFSITMTVGLFFAMLGDIFLNIEFIVGALLFAVGHIWYFVAYNFLQKFTLRDLIYAVAIFIPSVIFILCMPFFDFGSLLMEIIVITYALIISLMVGKSLSNLVTQPNSKNILLGIGSLLFFFSDLMLLLNVFGNLSEVFDVLCLATYYPAECILATAIAKQSTK
ncbi:MAG: lysoplasmalogenase [Clostridia bacterium]|nr:lysoplasmalogenase [Clostridia bacterium]